MDEPCRIGKVKGWIEIPYRWSCGKHLTQFFQLLKEKKITGAMCKTCRKIIVPPAPVCGRCFSDTEDELVEVKDRGRLQTYTVVTFSYPGQLMEPPYAVGIIRLDGADTKINHLVKTDDVGRLEIGSIVRAHWKEKRIGSFLDIAYFQVTREGE